MLFRRSPLVRALRILIFWLTWRYIPPPTCESAIPEQIRARQWFLPSRLSPRISSPHASITSSLIRTAYLVPICSTKLHILHPMGWVTFSYLAVLLGRLLRPRKPIALVRPS